MSKFLSALLIVGASSALLAGAQPPVPKIKNVPLQQTSAVSGSQMFTTYCAVCHGSTGAGDGPAATAMKYPPTDLTMLSRNNKGVFPADHINSVLKFGVENRAHGTPGMPIWGDLMRQLNPASPDSSPIIHQRISNLIDYLRKLQR